MEENSQAEENSIYKTIKSVGDPRGKGAKAKVKRQAYIGVHVHRIFS